MPPVKDAADNQAANAPDGKNGNISFCNDRVRQTEQKSKEKSDRPARQGRKVNASDNKTDGEAAAKGGQQRRALVWER